MPVVLEGGRSAVRILSAPKRHSGGSPASIRAPAGDAIRIGLVNNMPDAALEKTERQFIGLLNEAAGDTLIRLSFFSLPEIPRGDGARDYLSSYSPIEALWTTPLDGLIVTGTEPRAADLTHEPYWQTLTKVIDWADANTRSTIWSCLGAHAAVLHLDGIARHPLPDKCFGVFQCLKTSHHPIMKGVPGRLPIPHSRWNELREEELAAAGYSILTRSAEAGVDMFARQNNSLFLFFHGHPEYEARTLLGEYRRDVGRFLRRERETYPGLPSGYFDEQTTQRLNDFRACALADRRESLMEVFPECPEDRLKAAWRPAAERLMLNWLARLSTHERQPRAATFVGPAHPSGAPQPARRSVVQIARREA
jgi:homoserine O-succinyltransferase